MEENKDNKNYQEVYGDNEDFIFSEYDIKPESER